MSFSGFGCEIKIVLTFVFGKLETSIIGWGITAISCFLVLTPTFTIFCSVSITFKAFTFFLTSLIFNSTFGVKDFGDLFFLLRAISAFFFTTGTTTLFTTLFCFFTITFFATFFTLAFLTRDFLGCAFLTLLLLRAVFLAIGLPSTFFLNTFFFKGSCFFVERAFLLFFTTATFFVFATFILTDFFFFIAISKNQILKNLKRET